jgi:hypothetical protein
MNTYTVHFGSDLQYGCRDLEAETPEQALAQARRLAEKDWHTLDLDYFEACDYRINEIEVRDSEDNPVAVWHDDHLRLCLAAPDLLAAAEKVVTRWEQGDLAEAVRALSAAVAEAKGGDA